MSAPDGEPGEVGPNGPPGPPGPLGAAGMRGEEVSCCHTILFYLINLYVISQFVLPDSRNYLSLTKKNLLLPMFCGMFKFKFIYFVGQRPIKKYKHNYNTKSKQYD